MTLFLEDGYDIILLFIKGDKKQRTVILEQLRIISRFMDEAEDRRTKNEKEN